MLASPAALEKRGPSLSGRPSLATADLLTCPTLHKTMALHETNACMCQICSTFAAHTSALDYLAQYKLARPNMHIMQQPPCRSEQESVNDEQEPEQELAMGGRTH